MIITRHTLKTIGIWTLQRREFGTGDHDYVIKTDGKKVVDLFVNDLYDSKTERTVYTVEYSHFSRSMTLEETKEFIEHAQQALNAATAFQQEIDAAESE